MLTISYLLKWVTENTLRICLDISDIYLKMSRYFNKKNSLMIKIFTIDKHSESYFFNYYGCC